MMKNYLREQINSREQIATINSNNSNSKINNEITNIGIHIYAK